MDCYQVLYELRDFKIIPHKYRLCKDLKHYSRSVEELRKLWNYIITHCYSDQQVEAFVFDTVQLDSLDQIDPNQLLDHPMEQMLMPPSIPDPEPLLKKKLEPLNKIESEFHKCQKAMTSLAKMGYQLTPFVDGEWKKGIITEWRIVPSNELVLEYEQEQREAIRLERLEQERERAQIAVKRSRSNSFENLLLAASTIDQWH
jgi:hypothetical protein